MVIAWPIQTTLDAGAAANEGLELLSGLPTAKAKAKAKMASAKWAEVKACVIQLIPGWSN